jgi:hypothetical protein
VDGGFWYNAKRGFIMKTHRNRRVIWLILPLVFSLVSCQHSNSSSATSSFSSSVSSLPEEISDSTITLPNETAQNYLASFNAAMAEAVAASSNDAVSSILAFQKAEKVMKDLRNYKERVEAGDVDSIAEATRGKTGKLLNDEYWHLQYKLLYAFKYQLAISPTKPAYVSYLGQAKFDRYLSRDPNLVFTKRERQAPSLATLTGLLDEAKSLCGDAANAEKVLAKYQAFVEAENALAAAYWLYTIRFDIDNTDTTSLSVSNEAADIDLAAEEARTQALRAVYSSPCKDIFIKTYGEDFFTPYLKNTSGYSEALLALLSQENVLKNNFYQAKDETTKKQIFLDLVAVRRKIATQANTD